MGSWPVLSVTGVMVPPAHEPSGAAVIERVGLEAGLQGAAQAVPEAADPDDRGQRSLDRPVDEADVETRTLVVADRERRPERERRPLAHLK